MIKVVSSLILVTIILLNKVELQHKVGLTCALATPQVQKDL